MTLDFSQCRLPPFKHQREDVAWLMRNPFALIASEMRTGKSKIVIDACQFLYQEGKIDKVVVVAPSPVRDVWADKDLGEIAKHAWVEIPNRVTQYHKRLRSWTNKESDSYLEWYVTNFEFIRGDRLEELIEVCDRKTFLVLDEGSFVKNFKSLQTQACMELRKKCGRVTILNGTPIFHSPLDLFSQGNLLSYSILQCKYLTQFKARYAIQTPVLGYGGKPIKKVVGKGRFTKEIILQDITGWTNLEDIQARFEPYTVRRLQAECLDLPPKLDPVTLTAVMEPSEWKQYKQMRDEFVVWLNTSQVVTSSTAAIKALRLSQMTGGFLSGVEDAGIEESTLEEEPAPAWLDEYLGEDNGRQRFRDDQEGISSTGQQTRSDARNDEGDPTRIVKSTTVEIGRAKLDVLLWFIEQRLEADPNLHLVAWTRFRAELERMVMEVGKLCTCKHSKDEHDEHGCNHKIGISKCSCEKFVQLFQVGYIRGGQTRVERLAALSLLHPDTSPTGPVFVGGIEGTGSFGLNMTAAHTCVTMSSGYSPGKSAQTLDRVYGPGQKHPIAYFDIIAVGPSGQKTIDHDILVTRRAGESIATRTAAAWVKAMSEE